ncbi:MAG: isochorismatase family protein [Actinomycetales bacterium]|nr:isochorismatase family protein [Actinomycetales bacterium]
MTTLTGRSRTALIVIDMQNGVVGEAYERDRVIANVVALVDKARAEAVPVVWVAHSDDDGMPQGSSAWRYVDQLRRDASEPLVHKTFADSFEDTDLEAVLASLQVGRLIVVGAQTDECIRSTLHGAIVRGYDATLVSDAHTTEDLTEWGAPPPGQVISHTNMYWSGHRAPGRRAGTIDTASVDFSAPR